jgi:hypothetical protein
METERYRKELNLPKIGWIEKKWLGFTTWLEIHIKIFINKFKSNK